MLAVANLSFNYHDKPLLKSIQFNLPTGKLLHLRGNNGSGKTTLLQLLAGLRYPQEGEIRYNGHLISDDLQNYQRQLCFVGHKLGFNPNLTIRENCFFDCDEGPKNASLEDLLLKFNLQGLDNLLFYALSAGQKRRAGLLRLALSQANIWLLDEPLVTLDKDTIVQLMSLLKNHLLQGGQIILTSHQALPLDGVDCLEYVL